ncbi:MAG: hypothetical protein H7145_06725 [Akkermansiaceae bacterium]|nr:hypothetical protein [Armatimonadota bacterium]
MSECRSPAAPVGSPPVTCPEPDAQGIAAIRRIYREMAAALWREKQALELGARNGTCPWSGR